LFLLISGIAACRISCSMCLPQRSPRTFIIKTFHGKNLAARQEKSWLKKEFKKKNGSRKSI